MPAGRYFTSTLYCSALFIVVKSYIPHKEQTRAVSKALQDKDFDGPDLFPHF
jgi:hypothetical protein